MSLSSPRSGSGRLSGQRARLLRENLMGFGFLLPSLLLMFTFQFFPLFYAFYVSLHRWRIKQGAFVGLDNYRKALGEPIYLLWILGGLALLVLATWLWTRCRKWERPAKIGGRIGALAVAAAAVYIFLRNLPQMSATGDPALLNSLKITIFYSIGTVPIQIALSLALAYILFGKIRGKDFFRVAFFIPYVVPAVASATVFRVIFTMRPDGVMNGLLERFGLAPLKWLHESAGINTLIGQALGLTVPAWAAGPSLALVSIIIYNIWVFVGYDTVIFLAGLGNIPKELYDAAEIDGADSWRLFRYITLPLLSPITFFITMISIIGTFKAFNHIFIMREYGALGTVDATSLIIFDQMFGMSQYGYAAALAFVLFAVILALTLAQNRLAKERVFYG